MIKAFLVFCGMAFIFVLLKMKVPEWSSHSFYQFDNGFSLTWGVALVLLAGVFFWRSLGHKGK